MKKELEAHIVGVSLAILIAFAVFPVLVGAVDYHAGVKVGDWIKYGDLTVAWSGNGTEPHTLPMKEKWIGRK